MGLIYGISLLFSSNEKRLRLFTDTMLRHTVLVNHKDKSNVLEKNRVYKIHCAESVSYTHLDVYKRQSLVYLLIISYFNQMVTIIDVLFKSSD